MTKHDLVNAGKEAKSMHITGNKQVIQMEDLKNRYCPSVLTHLLKLWLALEGQNGRIVTHWN